MHEIVIDGVNLRKYDIFTSGAGKYNAPERDVTMVTVPGRSGDLVIDNHRFKNIDVTYPIYIKRDAKKNLKGIRSFFMRKAGYVRIEDSMNPEEFRMGTYKSGLDSIDTSIEVMQAKFDLVMNCKPQRFLKSGEQELTFTKSESIFNPTEFDALPLLYIEGNGTLLINDKLITVKDNSAGVYIDTEIREAYNGATNLNSIVSISEGLAIPSGVCQIGIDGLTKVVITPRWWTV